VTGAAPIQEIDPETTTGDLTWSILDGDIPCITGYPDSIATTVAVRTVEEDIVTTEIEAIGVEGKGYR